ncbi:hypothetical protein HO173_001649 [Letharia columbiana]|uniref:Fucose-specific lectin n=1 Tax=Letharia columbiana TaxID=112416 RepID=A0A8H6G3S4_9LECA|nr:uncharacterized protein HO173_001649 [Letharia columbiana]KAF6240039.1 hypothetical protein HO173_001649 [Letharia columbiana]
MVDPSDDPYSPVSRVPYAEKEVNHQTGLEVDHTQDGLRTVQDTAGLEAVPAEYQKGAIPQTNFAAPEKEAWNDADKEIILPDESQEPEKQSTLKRRWKLWALLAALLVIILVVAIAVPLSVRHHSSTNSSSTNKPSGNTSSGSTSSGNSNSGSTPKATRIASTEGAFNGTGLATLTENISTEPLLHLFYQNYTGNVQHAVRAPGGSWTGGDSNITTDARAATPLAAVNYTSNGNLTAHVFYVDSANLLQEKISTDNMTTWTDGPLGDSKFEASEASTAMTAFYSGSWLGKTAGKSAGIRLYYGAPDNCIHELSFSLGSSSSWIASSTFDSNTNGNAGMTSDWLESNATAQLWTLDTSNELKLWYYIYNTTNQNDQTPANIAYGQWAEGISTAPVNVLTNSSLTYALGLLVYQQPNSDVEAIPPLTAGPSGVGSWGAVVDSGTNSIDTAMTGGTLAAAALPIGTDTDVSTNGTYLYVFNQQNGSDISQSPWYENTWATESLIGKRDLQDWSIHEVDVLAQLPRSRDVSPSEAALGRDVSGSPEDRGSAGRILSVYDALRRGWKRSGIGR